MKKKLILATFTGADGSCGYTRDTEYPLTVTMFKGNIVAMHSDLLPTYMRVEYGSIFSMLENWTNVKVVGHGTEDPRDLTAGEEAAGIDFNPGGLPLVNNIKRKSADLMDLLHDSRAEAGQGGKGRYYSKAISYMEDAQMNAVKAATWRFK